MITLLLVLIAFLASCQSSKKSTDAICKIGTDERYGTAWVYFSAPDHALLVTAAHVVCGSVIVDVEFNTGEKLSGIVIKTDSTRDLALVYVYNAPRKKPLIITSREYKPLKRVYTCGHPVGLFFTHSQGRIQNPYRETTDNVSIVQHDLVAAGGASGSPVWVKNWLGRKRVIGVLVSYKEDMPAASFSVAGQEIIEFLKKK